MSDNSQLYPYTPVSHDERAVVRRHPVVVLGCGPIGLALALDLGQRGTPVLLLDKAEGVGEGSRAICFARRTLEIAHRLGFGQRLLDKGVVWNVGRVFHGEHAVYEFDLSPEAGLRYPAFINLQQPYFERFLVEQIQAERQRGAPIELRGGHEVTAVREQSDGVRLDVATRDGPYRLDADWLIACDGARSTVREQLGLDFKGRVFKDNFLIADVRMSADFPSERWFWFEPPFEQKPQSALLHKQPDNIWRVDFQLGWDIDRARELEPARVRKRVDAMLGPDADYELVWTSIYTFQCRRMTRFRHGSILFAGDSAHQVSPFGARGANSGIHDIDNLAWKLDRVVKGQAPGTLLDSYASEREYGADENILASTRTTDFLTPRNDISRRFRNAVLHLARHHSFARPLVNSGRLSVPCRYPDSPLNGPDTTALPVRTAAGSPCVDAPLGAGYLLDQLGGEFVLFGIDTHLPTSMTVDEQPLRLLALSANDDPSGVLAERYLGTAGSALYLIRPDQHVAARWTRFDEDAVELAVRRCLGR